MSLINLKPELENNWQVQGRGGFRGKIISLYVGRVQCHCSWGLTAFVWSLGLESHTAAVVFGNNCHPWSYQMMLQVKPLTLMGPCGDGELFVLLTGVLWVAFSTLPQTKASFCLQFLLEHKEWFLIFILLLCTPQDLCLPRAFILQWGWMTDVSGLLL